MKKKKERVNGLEREPSLKDFVTSGQDELLCFVLTCFILIARENPYRASKDSDDVTKDRELPSVAIGKVGIDLRNPCKHDGNEACGAQGLHDFVTQLA